MTATATGSAKTVGSTNTKYLIDSLNPTGYAQVLDELVSAVTKTYTYDLQRISENQLVGSTWTPSFYGYDGDGNRVSETAGGSEGVQHGWVFFGNGDGIAQGNILRGSLPDFNGGLHRRHPQIP